MSLSYPTPLIQPSKSTIYDLFEITKDPNGHYVKQPLGPALLLTRRKRFRASNFALLSYRFLRPNPLVPAITISAALAPPTSLA